MKYIITNPEAIPKDLAPGMYNTKVSSAYIEDGEFVVEVEYIGSAYVQYSSLLPLIKEVDDGRGELEDDRM